MSLSVAGVWQVDVWNQTVWADGVWREGAYSPPIIPDKVYAREEITTLHASAEETAFYCEPEITNV